jgi:hypothetical protein
MNNRRFAIEEMEGQTLARSSALRDFPTPSTEAKAMNVAVTRILFWTPRILSLLFAGFVSCFALDVFGEGYGVWQAMLALVMHLIPTGIILVVLAIAWWWEAAGGLLFLALGSCYLIGTWGRFHWSAYVVISGPLFVLGALYLFDWFYRRALRARSEGKPAAT